MWTKIKTWLAIAGTAILGVLLTLVGYYRRKAKKTEEKLDEAKGEVESLEDEKELQEKVTEIERDTNERIYEMKDEAMNRLSDIEDMDYNEIVRGFNERK